MPLTLSLVLSRVLRQRTKSQVARRHERAAVSHAELQRGRCVRGHASLVQGHGARRVCRPTGYGQAVAVQHTQNRAALGSMALSSRSGAAAEAPSMEQAHQAPLAQQPARSQRYAPARPRTI